MNARVLSIDSFFVQVVSDPRTFVRVLLRPLLIIDLLIIKLTK